MFIAYNILILSIFKQNEIKYISLQLNSERRDQSILILQ